MRSISILIGAVAIAVATPMFAQVPDETNNWPHAGLDHIIRILGGDNQNRAVIGASTRQGGKRDTLGILIESVTPGGPAEKAGLAEGNRIAAINSINLRLSPADVDDSDMDGLMTRRFMRELRKVKPGDEIELRVFADGAYKTVKVKTVSFNELAAHQGQLTLSRDADNSRPALGLSFGGSGSQRDTLGLLVTTVVSDGPAEKAGIGEGDRIAAINGVNVRVPASEAVGGNLLSANERHFMQELRKVKAGDVVELKVYTNGAMKTLKVKTAPAADIYKGRWGGVQLNGDAIQFNIDDGASVEPLLSIPPIPPMPPIPPIPEPSIQQLELLTINV